MLQIMKIVNFPLIFALAFALPLISPASAVLAADESAPTEPRFINGWGDEEVNKHDWQPYSEEAAAKRGVNEISFYPPGAEPTAEQIQAANELIEKTKAAAKRHNWYKFGECLKEGYEPYDISHYFNVEYANDGRRLDPDRPETLMYYWNDKGELKLVGVMYLLETNTELGPQLGGPLTTWHFHSKVSSYCWWDGPFKHPNADGTCQNGVATRQSPKMLHVWLVDHPDGQFGTAMGVPQKVVDALP